MSGGVAAHQSPWPFLLSPWPFLFQAHGFDNALLQACLRQQNIVTSVLAKAVNVVLSLRPREPLRQLVRTLRAYARAAPSAEQVSLCRVPLIW